VKIEKEKRGHNVVITSTFIDTLDFLLTSKRTDKRRKERHSSFINNQGKITTKIHTPFFIFFCVFVSTFTLSNNNNDDDVAQSIVPIELRCACGVAADLVFAYCADSNSRIPKHAEKTKREN
jgi:hypothetical protein